ncbi:MAG: small multi-drug export protein [Anaerolineae bacterium]|nr:small multi-drug export protein [Anaerolineae bacterium]
MSIAALVSIFGVAFLSLWASIPAGLALGVHVIAVVVTAAVSYACGVGLIVLVGQPLRERILRRFGGKSAGSPDSTIMRVWNRYGLIGLALLAPVTTGAQIGAIIGMSLNAPPRRLFVWMSLGGLAWAVIFAALISLGVAAVNS